MKTYGLPAGLCLVILCLTSARFARAEEAVWIGPLPANAPAAVRWDEVPAGSYGFSPRSPDVRHSVAPRAGSYGHGVVASPFRWGWFGAGRYDPTVIWHCDYYGKAVRWSHRHGY